MSYVEYATAEPERAMPLSMTAEVSAPTHASETFNAIGRMQSQFGNAAVSRGALRALKAGRIQAKLTVGAPGDPYEQEADRVAEQIMSRTSGPVVQRKCAACEAGAACKKCSHGAPKIQTKRDSHEPLDLGSQTTAGILSLGGGQPLPTPVREKFEPQFAQDFSGVRVHTGGPATALADNMGARAFTFEHNIVFGNGQYGPDSSDGQRLLAHELTHVVQQGAANGPDRVQADWLDDVKETAGAVVDNVTEGVSGAYETVKAVAGTAVEAISEGASGAYETAKAAVKKVGTAASAVASGASDVVSGDLEKTRANLSGQVSATRQKVMSADPDIVGSPERVQALNSGVSKLNVALAGTAAIPYAPVLVPIAETIGEILLAIGAAIAALSLGEILLIAAIIALIIALIYLIFFRDTRKFPDVDTVPKVDPKVDPKEQPKEKPKPKPDRPPPPPFPLPKPDCLPGLTPRTKDPIKVRDKRHPYFKRPVTVKDNRHKHTRNITPTLPGTPCTAAFLLSVVNQNPDNFGPFLQKWIGAAKSGDTTDYGSQMGSDTVVGYVDKVMDIILDDSNQLTDETWEADTGDTCGVDISTPDNPVLTSNARIEDAPSSAHMFPKV